MKDRRRGLLKKVCLDTFYVNISRWYLIAGLQNLRRYFELIIFQSYLQSTIPDTMQSFESVETFVKDRPGKIPATARLTMIVVLICVWYQSLRHSRKNSYQVVQVPYNRSQDLLPKATWPTQMRKHKWSWVALEAYFQLRPFWRVISSQIYRRWLCQSMYYLWLLVYLRKCDGNRTVIPGV